MTDKEKAEYVPYGEEWLAEIKKLDKDIIVDLYHKGMQSQNVLSTGTQEESLQHVKGIINDFEAGIFTKEEAVEEFGKYTFSLMNVFWKNVNKKIEKSIVVEIANHINVHGTNTEYVSGLEKALSIIKSKNI